LPEPLQWLRWLSPSTAGIEASLRFNQLGAPLLSGVAQLAWLSSMALLSWLTVLWLGARRRKAAV
jgi:ABC-2 type transport system permease protein